MSSPKTSYEVGAAGRVGVGVRAALAATHRYLARPVVFSLAFPPLLLVSTLLFTRSLWTNYIFDEQEALLANPYVNGGTLGFWQVFERDFWGLPPTGTIGSYRPLPNIIWRLLWKLRAHAWLPHWFNVVFHAVNAALLAAIAGRWLRRPGAAWGAGLAFVCAAVLTEAVCGVVGIADVLSGTFTLLVLYFLTAGPTLVMLVSFGGVVLGLLSKESMLTVVPMVALAALITAPLDHPHAPRRWLRALAVTVGAVGALVAYTYFRRHFFPVELPTELREPLPTGTAWPRRVLHAFLAWFHQPSLPTNAINNPLVEADFPHRVAGALRVYFRGLEQVLVPLRLSGDYSFPQEPVPQRLVFVESVLGAAALLLPPLVACYLCVKAWMLEASFPPGQAKPPEARAAISWRLVLALALLWVPVTYFPHSNIPILLPTVRAERFWYLPVVGTSLVLGLAAVGLWSWVGHRYRRSFGAVCAAFLLFQGAKARGHGFDYSSDLDFWRATSEAAPRSAKAHLNYGVMLGARGLLEERLVENRRALELAPTWPMAHIYVGDTLCRLGRADEAWPRYHEGFRLGPNQQGLIALALQCLWDQKAVSAHAVELRALVAEFPGSWIAYLAQDMLDNGEAHQGVDPKYRPRGYDQGPRE